MLVGFSGGNRDLKVVVAMSGMDAMLVHLGGYGCFGGRREGRFLQTIPITTRDCNLMP